MAAGAGIQMMARYDHWRQLIFAEFCAKLGILVLYVGNCTKTTDK